MLSQEIIKENILLNEQVKESTVSFLLWIMFHFGRLRLAQEHLAVLSLFLSPCMRYKKSITHLLMLEYGFYFRASTCLSSIDCEWFKYTPVRFAPYRQAFNVIYNFFQVRFHLPICFKLNNL